MSCDSLKNLEQDYKPSAMTYHSRCITLLLLIWNTPPEKRAPLWEKYLLLRKALLLPTMIPCTSSTIADSFHFHKGERGEGVKEHNLLPPILQGDRTTSSPSLGLAIYLDRLRSMHNVGSIIRTTEAFRLGNIYLSPTMQHNATKWQKSAMGSQLWIDIEMKPLHQLPRPRIGLETIEGGQEISTFIFPPHCTLVVGNEEEGISQTALQEIDELITIPLYGKKNSLNVACAFAIAAQAISQQRRRTTISTIDEKERVKI